MKIFPYLAAALVAGLLLAWFACATPAPRRLDAPAAAFSAERAMVDVRAIAARPHPTGSPANAQVRDYLVGRLKGLGLDASTQRGRALGPAWGHGGAAGGDVENVVGVLAGRDRKAPALLLMSHYDAVPNSPGAADDAAGVSTTLEIVRALKASGTPERDVIVLFTDGEEAGLLGAEAFFHDHPLAKRAGVVMNLESRGGGGRTFMFETGRKSGGLVSVFARKGVRPSSNSLAAFLYEHMPNDTDFTVFKQAGVQGLNFAFIGRPFDYHSPSATPENLEVGALQHMGDQTLAVAEATAFARDLPKPAPDLVYSDVLGARLVAYPAWGGWVLLAAAVGLVGFALVRTRRAWTWVDLARGAGAAVYLGLVGWFVLKLTRVLTGAPFGFEEQRPLLAQFAVFEAALLAMAFATVLAGAAALRRGGMRLWAAGVPVGLGLASILASGFEPMPLGLAAGAAVLGFFVFARPTSAWGGWGGVLLLGLIVALALQILAPTTAFIVVWPLLAGAVSAAVAASGSGGLERAPVLTAVAAVAALALGQTLSWAHGVALGVGSDLPGALTLFVFLSLLFLFPLLWTARPAKPGALALAAGLGLLLVLRLHDPASARTPRDSHVLYLADTDTGRAWRVSAIARPDAWTRAVLAADAGVVKHAELPALPGGKVWAAPARSVATEKAQVTIERTADGLVVVRAAAPAGTDQLRLVLSSTAAGGGATVNGEKVSLAFEPNQPVQVLWAAPGAPVETAFRPKGPGALTVRWTATRLGWPAEAKPLPPRPKDVAPWNRSDSTVAAGSARLQW